MLLPKWSCSDGAGRRVCDPHRQERKHSAPVLQRRYRRWLARRESLASLAVRVVQQNSQRLSLMSPVVFSWGQTFGMTPISVSQGADPTNR
ncbi:hypothetical protein APV28_4397 [Comamonas testosteroni]|nr:hypothetical protein APV28_4397 [Comamonas testosteroni]